MIWALLAMYLFGSSGSAQFSAAFEQTKTFIKSDIEDKTRRTELLSVIEKADKTTKEYVKTGGKVIKELSSLSEKYEAKTGDFQPVLEKFRADTATYQDQMIRQRFALKAKMSREEWSRVFPKEASSSTSPGVQGK